MSPQFRMLMAPAIVCGLLLTIAGCTHSKTAPEKSAAPTFQPIRINAGAAKPITDKAGNTWLADAGFTGGGVVDRGDIPIASTTLPDIYRTEHHSMTAFSWPLPNGRYTVVLHFAETFPRITAAGERVFDVDVEGMKLPKLDVFKEMGARKALVMTIPVTINDGKLDITFTKITQSPEINAIEILPAR